MNLGNTDPAAHPSSEPRNGATSRSPGCEPQEHPAPQHAGTIQRPAHGLPDEFGVQDHQSHRRHSIRSCRRVRSSQPNDARPAKSLSLHVPHVVDRAPLRAMPSVLRPRPGSSGGVCFDNSLSVLSTHGPRDRFIGPRALGTALFSRPRPTDHDQRSPSTRPYQSHPLGHNLASSPAITLDFQCTARTPRIDTDSIGRVPRFAAQPIAKSADVFRIPAVTARNSDRNQ